MRFTLAFCALTLVVAFSSIARAEDFVRGDGNGDAAVDIADPVFVFLALFGSEGPLPCADAADANDDGAVDVADVAYLLNYLFGDGTAPPPPGDGPCGGVDPTLDELACSEPLEPPLASGPPRLRWTATYAPARGLEQRTRLPLSTESDDTVRADLGVAFSLLLEASAHPDGRAPVEILLDPHTVDPEVLAVRCDRDLLSPEGIVPAGTNLAPWFSRETEGWIDPIYLTQEVALRVDRLTSVGPIDPGRHVFTAEAVDTACARASPAAIAIEIVPSLAPRISIAAIDETGAPHPHHAGSGNLRVSPGADDILLEIDATPNAAVEDAPIDAESLHVSSSPPVDGAADLTERFERVAPTLCRWRGRVPVRELTPGNTTITVSLRSANDAAASSVLFTIELEVSYARDVQSIWNANCSGCHEGPNAARGLELVAPGEDPEEIRRSFVNVFAAGPSIESVAPVHVRPFFPRRSYLFHKLEGTHLDEPVRGSGERMPADGPPYLSEAAIHTVRSWIVQGAAP